jgi:GMP synthase (glutamine-hydrolysing)
MRLHILMHESFEAPAAIETWARVRGHSIAYTRFYQGDVLPETVDNLDYLIIMGGPQSPATTEEESPHYHAKDEMAFIKKAIDADKLVLGVCLGAQLIGDALGAAFGHSPEREIGVFNISLTPEAKNDPIFSTFPDTFPVGHWHCDMPGLTSDAVILATSPGCPRQVVRYTPKVYGFQCHFEFTPEAVEGMIENNSHELEQFKGMPYIQTAEELRKNDYKGMNELLLKFLNYMEYLS